MNRPVLEVLSGPADGANVVFRTEHSFIAGTVQIFLDGQAKVKSNDDGWTEVTPNIIKMKIAPGNGSLLQAFYLVG